MHILIIDDDPLAGALAAAILEGEGHEVVVAEHALDAMEQLNAQTTIEIIVCDMNMPLMSGLELFTELRQQNNRIPFILLTGDDSETFCSQEPRLDACLMKDANLEHSLPQAINRVLANRKT